MCMHRGGVEKHRLVYGGTVSLGATYVTEAASTLTPIGLRAQGVRPAAHQLGAGRWGPPPTPPPPQQGWVRSRVRKCEGPPPAGCYPQAAGRRGAVDWRPPPPSPGGSGILPGGRDGGGLRRGHLPPPRGVGGYKARPEIFTPRGGVTPRGGRGRGHGATRGRRGRQRSEGPPEVGGATRGRRGHQRSKGPPEV